MSERVSITHDGETIETDTATIKGMGYGVNLPALRNSIIELEQLFILKQEAAENCKNGIKVVAIKAGIIDGVLTQYIAARCNDTVKKKAQSANQLSLLFSEITV